MSGSAPNASTHTGLQRLTPHAQKWRNAACIDAPGVDRAKLYIEIGSKALEFFNAALGAPR
jgi:hypothetical protein